jgi:DNA-binding protein H-NS
MTTYLELRAKGEKLLAEAEQLRVKEIAEVIEDIKQKISAYGLTAQDLGIAGGTEARRRKSTPGAQKPKAKAKYRGPNGEEWSGGRGRKPRWVTEALAKGKSLADFAI